VLLRVPRVQEHLRCHQLRRTSPILGLGYGARERRDNTLACNAIPQKRDLQSHSFTNLTAESRRHIYKNPDFSGPDSMRNNRLIAFCNPLYITTGWIVLDVCRLEDCQPERRLPTRRPMALWTLPATASEKGRSWRDAPTTSGRKHNWFSLANSCTIDASNPRRSGGSVRKDHRSECVMNRMVEMFGDQWSLLVIRDIMFMNRRHFRELLTDSQERIASNILADRLQKLVKLGIIVKSHDPSHKQKAIYSLTEKGIDLLPLLMEMSAWGQKHVPGSGLRGLPQLLKEGGPKLRADFMAELRESHRPQSIAKKKARRPLRNRATTTRR
jgi:DNA-binding HxlR family transcriptional regulator